MIGVSLARGAFVPAGLLRSANEGRYTWTWNLVHLCTAPAGDSYPSLAILPPRSIF